MDIDRLRYLREPRLVNLDLIHTIGHALQIQSALIVGAEDAPILVRFTDDLNLGSHDETGWIDHLQAQLTAVALAENQ